MTSQPFDRDDAANEVAEDVQPARTDEEGAVVDLDRPKKTAEGEESADDKYIDVIDGRPETLGFETKEGGAASDT